MRRTPIVINCRDRLAPLVQLVDFLERGGQERIYLLDNDSAYPPLLDYLEHSPHEVVRLGRNGGRLSLWEPNLFEQLDINGRFVFTDPDIVPDERCPLDAIEYFAEILDLYPELDKVGFGLRIDDIPDAYRFKQQVVSWESQFWERQIAPRVFDAWVDTTFALYREPAAHRFDRSARTGFPYVARHTPWYLDDRSLPEDEAFYRERSEGDDVNNWGRESLVPELADAILARESIEVGRRVEPVEPPAPTTPGTEELHARLAAAEAEIGALRASKTFRYTQPARHAYALLRARRTSAVGETMRRCLRLVERGVARHRPTAGTGEADPAAVDGGRRMGVDAMLDIRALLSDVDSAVVFDVGANVGQSVTAFRELLPNSVVYSFEPGAAAFRELTDRTAELADVHVFHLAVGAASGPQTLIETDYSDMSSFLQPSPANWSSAVAKTVVHVTTLDEFCAAEGIESIDLLKIDTQGYELEVLRGAPGLISGGAIRLIYLEVNFAELYEGLPSFDMLFRFLVDRGFRLVALYNYRSFAEPSSAASWCDALFTRA